MKPFRSTVHSRALQRAALILGGTDQLRAFLHVPMAHLKSWLEGVEAPPPDVFLKVVDLVFDHDLPGRPADPNADPGKLQVRVGPNTARCPACECIDFLLAVPGSAIDNLTVLKCSYCGREVTRGNLIVAASDEGAKRSAAGLTRLKRQQAALKEPPSGSPLSDGVKEPGDADSQAERKID